MDGKRCSLIRDLDMGRSRHNVTLAMILAVGGSFAWIQPQHYFIVVAFVVVLLTASNLRDFGPARMAGGLAIALTCTLPIFVSGLLNQSPAFEYLGLLAFLLFGISAYVAGSSMADNDMSNAIGASALPCLAIAISASAIFGWDLFGALLSGNRYFAGINPTLLGLLGLALSLVGLAARPLMARVPTLAFGALIILSASSRSALLALLVASLCYAFLAALRLRRGTAILSICAISTFLIIAAFPDPVINALSGLFLLDDRYRGTVTGGSGRLAIWSFFLDRWAESPLFGSGPGLLYNSSSKYVYSHNMIIQILSDGGLLGLLGLLVFVGAFCVALFRSSTEDQAVGFTALAAYVSYGIFEGRAVSIGNPLSVYFFLICFLVIGSKFGSADKLRRASAWHQTFQK